MNIYRKIEQGENIVFSRPEPDISKDDRRFSAPGSYPSICFNNKYFWIFQKDFDSLPEYSMSKPSGVYDGKCWKIDRGKHGWFIGCYIEEQPPHPDGMLTVFRKAIIL